MVNSLEHGSGGNLSVTNPANSHVLSGEGILAQIAPELRGDVSKRERPSDVRVLLRTENLQGRTYQFPNHGHPENEMSTVAFDGENAIVFDAGGGYACGAA